MGDRQGLRAETFQCLSKRLSRWNLQLLENDKPLRLIKAIAPGRARAEARPCRHHDVIYLMGFYTSVSMTLAFYEVPAGAEGMAR